MENCESLKKTKKSLKCFHIPPGPASSEGRQRHRVARGTGGEVPRLRQGPALQGAGVPEGSVAPHPGVPHQVRAGRRVALLGLHLGNAVEHVLLYVS